MTRPTVTHSGSSAAHLCVGRRWRVWYNLNMDTRLSSNVADLSDEQRKTVEALIGQPLRSDQVLYWIVMNPGREPTAADKAKARAGLQNLFAKVDRQIDAEGTTPEQFEAAVDEAVRHVRSQSVE